MQQMNDIRTIWATAEAMDILEVAAAAAAAAVYQHLAIDHMVSNLFCFTKK